MNLSFGFPGLPLTQKSVTLVSFTVLARLSEKAYAPQVLALLQLLRLIAWSLTNPAIERVLSAPSVNSRMMVDEGPSGSMASKLASLERD